MKIILASSSPYRRDILSRLGVEFESVSPHIDESPRADETAPALVKRLAVTKAEAVASRFPAALTIGCDQVAELNGTIIGKPKDHADAVEQLRAASGAQVNLFTGIALLHNASGRLQTAVEPFEVHYRALTHAQIERYLELDQPYNCCGSLRVESRGIALLKHLHGSDPNALIGLPVIRLIDMLQNEGVSVV